MADLTGVLEFLQHHFPKAAELVLSELKAQESAEGASKSGEHAEQLSQGEDQPVDEPEELSSEQRSKSGEASGSR